MMKPADELPARRVRKARPAYPVRMLRIEAAAMSAAVSADTIRRAIDRGDLEAIQVGPRTIIIPVANFEAWLAGMPRVSA